jgi:3-phenylpropionate/trans-cinnamate dioxygenase ferredoxin subunit
MTRHVVCAARDLPPGARKLVHLDGRPILVLNVGGDLHALLNICPHQGASLADGVLTGLVESPEPGVYRYSREGEILRCPWHGWEFDVKTGKSWCKPQRIRLKDYPVDVRAGGDLVEGPYVAETFPVAVDDSYVVVEVAPQRAVAADAASS